MKVKMKSKLTAIAISLFMAFMILPAMGEQAYAEGIVEVKKGGDDDNFAADAPIATVRLDRSKFTKKNAALTASGNQNVQDGYELADGKVWAKDCAINANYKNIGGFTLAFPDAAILPDGTRKPVEVVFHDVHVIRKTGAEAYEDDICIARITGDPYAPIAFSPLTSQMMHMALRAQLSFRVREVGSEDVFLFDARGINNVRSGQEFESIVNASAHYNYSESMEPASGVVAGSHLYLPADSTLRVEMGSSSPTLGHRFLGSGAPDDGVNHGFAAAAQAKNGFQSRVWSSAGKNSYPVEIFFLGGGLSHELTVSSGDGGRIELWSDGRLDSDTAGRLPGGTLGTPYTYDVPNGKQVTLKMTPDSRYELDKLYVNGEETAATEVTDSAGNVTHCTYTFDSDQTGEQDISVTWRALPMKEKAVITKAPTARELTHNGEAQALVNGGTARGGTMQYALGADVKTPPEASAFTGDIPEETEVGIYYVWYKAAGDQDHLDTEPECVIAEIKDDQGTVHVHKLSLVEAKDAGCTGQGSTAYYVCDGCGRWFEDATGVVEITDKSSVIVKALGHRWDSGVVTKEASYTAAGIRTFTCLNDSSHTRTEVIPKKEKHYDKSDSTNDPAPQISVSWTLSADGWHYLENGVQLRGVWRELTYNGRTDWYYFDESGVMKTGWLFWNENWYYLYPVSDGWMGRMLTGWQQIEGRWYYFETEPGKNQGCMYRSERTPDGFYVGADGAWVQ